jgi:DNA-binding transcriptional ArsR family regulator
MSDREQLVFAALADPTRRQLIEILVAEGQKTATDLSSQLPITRQGTAKHLSILVDAGLVEKQHVGRETLYTLNPEPLRDTVEWVEAVNALWGKRLQALRDYLLDDQANQPE